MILPTKHLSVNDSILGGGAVLLHELSTPKTVSRLWERVKTDPRIGNFKRFSLALSFLYAVDAIVFHENQIFRKVRR
jgi:hypothetical protein